MTHVRTGLTADEEVIVHSEKVLAANARITAVDSLVRSAP